MPVYNGAAFVQEALTSILEQTFDEFEFLIVDDGSTDATYEILSSCRDPRVHLLRNHTNLGLARSLNRGLTVARGRYVARMDADDASLSHRLRVQTDFMDAHPEVGLCGAWIEVVGEGVKQVWRYPSDHDTIRTRLLFESTLAHPVVMMNRRLLEEDRLSYDETFGAAQDYELWSRAASGCVLANLPEVLLTHRLHGEQVGQRKAEIQQAGAAKVRARLLQQMGISPTSDEFQTHQTISSWTWGADPEFPQKADVWLQRLVHVNRHTHTYPEVVLEQVVGERWLAICETFEGGPGSMFWRSPLSRSVDLGWKNNLQRIMWRGFSYLGFTHITPRSYS
jgi:glycosyltransferase involved in cell wall biosynthesis